MGNENLKNFIEAICGESNVTERQFVVISLSHGLFASDDPRNDIPGWCWGAPTETEEKVIDKIKAGQPLSNREIGKCFSVTPERVRQIYSKGMKKLRAELRLGYVTSRKEGF